MRFSWTSLRAVSPAALLLALAGCGAGGGVTRACGTADECGGPFDRCLQGSCVEDAAPLAVLAVPEGVELGELVEADGSGSADPDEALGDGIAAYRWALTSLDAPCDAPTVSGTGASVRLRFACAGAFQVELVVVDALGKEAVATAAVVVSEPAVPRLVAGADRTVQHRCAGTPLRCATEQALALQAGLAAGVEAVGEVTYGWTVDPPAAGTLGVDKRVTFSPSAAVADPTVSIEVDGTDIVDDWVLRVRARDDLGLLGEAVTRVSVGNRPPILEAAVAAVSVNHAFSGGAYRATASASRWSDPDGDPLTMAAPTGDADCPAFTIDSGGAAVISCTRSYGGLPSALQGFAGASHAVSVRVKDPWVAAAASSTAVTILNRAPVAEDSTTSWALSCVATGCCKKDGEGGCLIEELKCPAQEATAVVALGDPDGDPLEITFGTSSSGVCLPGACEATFDVPAGNACGYSGSREQTFHATDGLATSETRTVTLHYSGST